MFYFLIMVKKTPILTDSEQDYEPKLKVLTEGEQLLEKLINSGTSYVTLETAIKQCRDPKVKLVLVSGMSGSGKSTASKKFENPLNADDFLYLRTVGHLSSGPPLTTPGRIKSIIGRTLGLDTFKKHFIDPGALWGAVMAIKLFQSKGYEGQEITLPIKYYRRYKNMGEGKKGEENCFDFGLKVTVPKEGDPLVVEGTMLHSVLTAENFQARKPEIMALVQNTVHYNVPNGSLQITNKEFGDLEYALIEKEESKDSVRHLVLHPPIVTNILNLLLRDIIKGKFEGDYEECQNRIYFRLKELLFFELADQDWIERIINPEKVEHRNLHNLGKVIVLKTPKSYTNFSEDQLNAVGEEYLELLRRLVSEMLQNQTSVRSAVSRILKAKGNERFRQIKESVGYNRISSAEKDRLQAAIDIFKQVSKKRIANQIPQTQQNIKKILQDVLKAIEAHQSPKSPPQTEPPAGSNIDGTDPASTD